jgi:maltose O-acetyltransferase
MDPMTEREKMLAGELYQAWDPELVAARRNARRLTRLFNEVTEEERDERLKLLSELLGGMGEEVYIEPPFRCDYGKNIYLGDRVYMNFGCIVLDCADVRIGNDVMFAPNVQFYAATHPIDAMERIAGPELARPITIGDRVWIGGGAIICPGVTIGENTVIGAGSVVTKSIPANVVAAGNPCRIIRNLA